MNPGFPAGASTGGRSRRSEGPGRSGSLPIGEPVPDAAFPRPLRLNDCIRQAVELLRRTLGPGVEIAANYAGDLGLVEADSGQINQVLMNLCLNARDAMPNGGRLELETLNVTVEEAEARGSPDKRPGDFVRVRVRDGGHGIPPEILPRIFDPFFTTKEVGKGTGLGLSVVFGIVKQHRGWIECRSTVGAGTCFDVYLPRLG